MAAPSAGFELFHRPDAEVNAVEDLELRRLLLACFPYETSFFARRYVRMPPAHRWLVRAPSGELVAHAAAHDKIISAGGVELRVGGIAEVCVAHSWRGRGLLRAMLAAAHEWMRSESIPFAMLFGQPKVYASSGYKVIDNPILAENALTQHLNPFKGKPMIHPLTSVRWPSGPVDLRGPTF